MNVPKLRFKEFNCEWKEKELSEFTDKITEKNKNLSITNVISNSAVYGLISQRVFFDKDIANNDNINGYYIIENNDFVYNPRKSNEAPYGPINRFESIERGVISPLYLCFKSKNINSIYLEKYFKSNMWHRYIYLNGDAGARHDRVSIKDETFFKLPIRFPKMKEQTKIANMLQLLDKKIELQSKKIEALNLYKKGLLNQYLFGIDNYKEYKLGDICKITTGKLDANAMVENGKYRFYTCAKEFYFIDKYDFDTEALLISGNGANVGYIHYYKGKFNAYQRTYVLDDFKQNIHYIKIYLDKYLASRISAEKREGNTPYITLSTIEDMVIKIPKEENINKIVNSITLMSTKINLENKNLDNLQQLKKGLMQSMFV